LVPLFLEEREKPARGERERLESRASEVRRAERKRGFYSRSRQSATTG